jgi:hypothetical protein
MALVPGGEALLSVDEERVRLDLQIVLQASLVHQQVLKSRFGTGLEQVGTSLERARNHLRTDLELAKKWVWNRLKNRFGASL